MLKRILVDGTYQEEVRVAVLENKKILDYDYESAHKPQLKGNIYLAKVTRIEPSLQAVFIEYGGGKHGFLPFSEIHPNYFAIPVADRPKNNPSRVVGEDIAQNFKQIDIQESADVQDEDDDLELSSKTDAKLVKTEVSSDNHENQDDTLEVDSKLLQDVVVKEQEIIDEDIVPFEEQEESYRNIYKKYKIQEVIKKNQVLLVQVIKEERGNKSASFTSFISLAGRYCVLMPNVGKQGGISRRVIDLEKRRRLRTIVEKLNVPEGVSVIIRTAGEDRSRAEIRRDYDYLVKLWNSIREHTIASKVPTFIHAEGDLIKRTVRDVFDDNTKEIIVQGTQAYQAISDFCKKIFPGNENRIKEYKGSVALFEKFGIESQVSALYNPVSNLDSGGYLVINATEALTSIDVNSGKSTSERNIEETAVKTNIEAAKEIARQVRLRDISGLIIIDFIDMVEFHNRRNVERVLRDAFKDDKARTQISSISPFGLVEISRQRLRSSFAETYTVACNHCNGKGRIREQNANALMILRTVEAEIASKEFEEAIVYSGLDVILNLLNNKRDHIRKIEEKYSTKLQFKVEENIAADCYSIERIPRGEGSYIVENTPTVDEEDITIEDIDTYQNDDDADDMDLNSDQKQDENSRRHIHRNTDRRVGYSHPSRKFSKRPNNNFKKRRKKFENETREKLPKSKEESWWKRLFR